MLAARSLAYTDPQAGGTSGIFLVGLFERLGIVGAMRRKALTCINGDEVVDKGSPARPSSARPSSARSCR
jgi:molybdate transport system substrate-binding protein